MSSWSKWVLSVACFSWHCGAVAQHMVYNLDDLSKLRLERSRVHQQSGVHMGMQPIFIHHTDPSGVQGLARDSTPYYYTVTAKLFGEHLLELDRPGLKLAADVLIDLSYGKEWIDEITPNRSIPNIYNNTRGFAIRAFVGDAVYVYTDFRENQSRFPGYMHAFVDSLNVVPGMGRVKPFGESGYDYSVATGYIGVHPTKWLSVQAGHFRQFIGHGYRSLLLSDNAFNYPCFRYQVRLWKGRVQYDWSIALMQNLTRLPQGEAPESLFERKYGSWSYLSFRPIQRLEIGFFESVIWKLYDAQRGTLPFDFNALNPVPFANSLTYGLDADNANALVGVSANLQVLEPLRIYGQYMRDSARRNKGGRQLGLSVSGILDRIDAQLEYNSVDIGSYAAPVALRSYTNLNQPLAHPLGSGFKELVVRTVYYHNRWLMRYHFTSASLEAGQRDPTQALDSGQSARAHNTLHHMLHLGYVFNPKSNLEAFARFHARNVQADGNMLRNDFWQVGIRTNLLDSYRDF